MSSTWGAQVLGANRPTAFQVWAPRAKSVELELPERGLRLAMDEHAGLFSCEVRDAGAGTDYWYRLDGEKMRPDPRSHHQPNSVHGPSRVVDAGSFLWSDAAFSCPVLRDFVIYELHIGTFSREGTFDAAIAHLPHLVRLGVTAVEVMPIAQFPGSRNWGYDGVFPFAPQDSYGGPAGFARFVDACHAHGLAVVLDVVYNHLGPEGNYLSDFGPYFSERYKTEWGNALNFDGPYSEPVRRYFIDNALYWLRDFHVDALRLDAVHAIVDLSARHVLEELHDAVEQQASELGRRAYLIAESDLNDARIIRPRELGGIGLHAQWNDDFHHALRTLLVTERKGHLVDYGRVSDLGRAFTHGYVYAGEYSEFRKRRHGNSSLDRPGEQFVVCQQNHDQVGNTSRGSRLASLSDLSRAKLAAVAVACAPNLPMLFMGEEFFAQTPFAYFVSHSDAELAEAVRRGRLSEHANFGAADDWHDPNDEASFEQSKLDWTCLERKPHSQMLQFYLDLFQLRKTHSCLSNCDKAATRASWDDEQSWLLVERAAEGGERALCAFNFSAVQRDIPAPHVRGRFRLALDTADAHYGGVASHAVAALNYYRDDAAERPIVLGPTSALIYLNT